MFCNKCGAQLKDDANFCTNCGATIKEMKSEQINTTNNIAECQNVDFDKELINAYIGKKADTMYDKTKNGGFSIFGFLFGFGYFVYRKMYLIVIVTTLIFTVISYICSHISNSALLNEFWSSLLSILSSVMFYPSYKWDITRKLRKIKQENPNASKEQLLNLAQQKGGVSVIGVIIYIIIVFLALILEILEILRR